MFEWFLMKQKISVFIILFIVGILVITVTIGKINSHVRFNNEVKQLFAYSKQGSQKRFGYEQLSGLPEPVQRYFKHVLKEGQPYINEVRLLHSGQFKTAEDKDWVSIQGEEYFITDEPWFIWQGKTSMFTASDRYINNKGSLVVSLFSVFNVVRAQGQKYDEAELQRWLGESVWFPTNLLPHENLQWMPIDNLSAKLIFSYNGTSVCYIVKFNSADEISELETQRYMGEKNLETWIGKLSDYKEVNRILIPTAIEAIYKLKKGDYSYAKFKVKVLEYGKPKRF